MKIIINNTALRNNGDAAIVTALYEALREAGFDLSVATPHRQFVRRHYPNIPTCADVLGYSFGPAKRNRWLGSMVALLLLIFSREYRRANIVMGAPGGYLNSFYGFAWKLQIYRWAKALRKRTIVYAQSVGPLVAKDAELLRTFSCHLDLLVARDDYSFRTALESGIGISRLRQTPDAVFLKAYGSDERSRHSNIVAFSVREWRHDGRSKKKYVELVCACVDLVLSLGYRVDFISTCQGASGYTDDSVLASEIVASRYRSQNQEGIVSVDTSYHSVHELEEKIRCYNFVIGTRLHMCLLSLVNGVPAFNVSYEMKGKESYTYLGYPEFSTDYNEEIPKGVSALTRFIEEKEVFRAKLPVIVEELNGEARRNLRCAIEMLVGAESWEER